MEMLCMGFLAGVIFSLITFALCCLRVNADDEPATTAEQALNVLENMRIGATVTEKRGIDYAAECINKVDRVNTWIEEGQHGTI